MCRFCFCHEDDKIRVWKQRLNLTNPCNEHDTIIEIKLLLLREGLTGRFILPGKKGGLPSGQTASGSQAGVIYENQPFRSTKDKIERTFGFMTLRNSDSILHIDGI